MTPISLARTRRLRIIAQDPRVLDRNNRILTASVDVPCELLLPGPWGHRVQVIDFDSSSNVLYPPASNYTEKANPPNDPFESSDPDSLILNYRFHAQNAYAIVMRTLARFEQALGRRVNWACNSHQLKIVPHAFAEVNAFYSRNDEALLFGYFPGHDGKRTIFTCLSHDVIVHETTHALLDGLRQRFIDPSSPDQAAFHEGFADIVALLSVFSLHGIVEAIISRKETNKPESENLILAENVSPDALKRSALFGLADQMGEEIRAARGEALRRSAALDPSPKYVEDPEFLIAHRRGEILVAAVMNAFINVWSDRLEKVRQALGEKLHLQYVAEEGKDVADYLLTMAIRALDYTPPVHIEFCDYLNALISADIEIRPDDSRYHFREHLRRSFEAYGIKPVQGTPSPTRMAKSSTGTPKGGNAQMPAIGKMGGQAEPGTWAPANTLELAYDRTHFEPMTRDPEEVFRFIWENRVALEIDGGINEGAFSKVLSVRPCLRIAPDGFVLKETVAEFYQVIRLQAKEFAPFGITVPHDMPLDTIVPLYGGGTFIFDEYGRLKLYIHNSLDNSKRQSRRIADLWRYGALPEHRARRSDFAQAHRLRAMDADVDPQEEW